MWGLWRGPDRGAGAGRVGVQVFDIPTFCLAVTEYFDDPGLGLRARHDRGPDAGRPRRPGLLRADVVGAATLLASQDVIGLERTADLMSALLGVEVSTGFISSCLARLDEAFDRGRVRGRTQEIPTGGAGVGHRRDTGPADRGSHRAGGLPQPARVHGPMRTKILRDTTKTIREVYLHQRFKEIIQGKEHCRERKNRSYPETQPSLLPSSPHSGLLESVHGTSQVLRTTWRFRGEPITVAYSPFESTALLWVAERSALFLAKRPQPDPGKYDSGQVHWMVS